MALPPYQQAISQSDLLPSYTSSITLRGRLLCKQELEKPTVQALERHWQRIEAEIRGTALILSFVSSTTSNHTRSYTLQAADAGLAVDYKQRPDAFRIRVEGEQLLFIAPDAESATAWVEALLAVIAISEPLDERPMPKYPSLPTRGAKPLGGEVMMGFRERLWTELSWRSRHRREWLLRTPSRSFGERWAEVVRGSGESTRRSSTSSQASGSTGRSYSTSSSRCQCPCAACWRTSVSDPFVGEEDNALVRQGSLPRPSIVEHGDSIIKRVDFGGPQSALGSSYRCTRVLTRWAKWKGDHYVKSGRLIEFPHAA